MGELRSAGMEVKRSEAFFQEEAQGVWLSPLVIVCCYNGFDDLAHQPRGTMANKYSLMIFKVDLDSGRMTCASVVSPTLRNPAFIRVHPSKNVFWVCTESITDHGEVHAFEYAPHSGACRSLGHQ